MEEELIYELVDLIVKHQNKIVEIKQKSEEKSDDETLKDEKIYKNLLSKNLKVINDYEKEIKSNVINIQNIITETNFHIGKIDDELLLLNEKLTNLNISKDFYKQYYDKIKSIFLNKEQLKNAKNVHNKYNILNKKINDLIKEIHVVELEKNKYFDEMEMLKEEKAGIDNKIIEYMSLKESFEEIAKVNLKKFIFNNLRKNEKKFQINSEKIPDIKIYHYEFNIIDINKISEEIPKPLPHATVISSVDSLAIVANMLINKQIIEVIKA